MDDVIKRLAAGEEPLPALCPNLYLNRVEYADSLYALQYGVVYDAQGKNWREISDDFAFLRPDKRGPAIGFGVRYVSTFDTGAREVAAIWDEPLFNSPALGLARAPAGEIVLAAQAHFGSGVSFNRVLFNGAMGEPDPEKVLSHWYACLEAGDSMAHFAVGYSLFELERYHESYRHLRYYVEISPHHPWNWCWFGRAAAAIGELDEARLAYERAIELTAGGSEATDAPELLAQLPR